MAASAPASNPRLERDPDVSRLLVHAILLVVVLAGAVGGYRYFTRTEVVQIEAPATTPTAPQPRQETAQPRINPHQKRFEDRFQPKP